MRGDAGAAGAAVALEAAVLLEEEARGLLVQGAVVAAEAIELRRLLALLPEAAVCLGGVATRAGVEPSAGVEGPKPGLTRCSADERERNIESIWGFNIWPNGVARNSAGKPDSQWTFKVIAKPNRRNELTCDPCWRFSSGQEPDYVRRKIVAVELDQVVGLCRVQLGEGVQVFIECRFVNLCLSHVQHLYRLAMMRGPGSRLEDALPVKDLTSIYDDRCMPIRSAVLWCDGQHITLAVRRVMIGSPNPVYLLAGQRERHLLRHASREVVHIELDRRHFGHGRHFDGLMSI